MWTFISEFGSSAFAVLALAVAALQVFIPYSKDNKQVKLKEDQLSDIVGAADLDLGPREILMRDLRAATVREEIILFQSKSRGDLLYRIGSFFLVLSIMCPIAAAWLYCTIDPIPQATIDKIVELKKSLTELPKELSISVGRDWHLLLGGITFGFLCLAAAKGILAQQAKEMSNYFSVAEKVNYFERLRSVAKMKLEYIGSDKIREAETIDIISGYLINNESWTTQDKNKNGDNVNEQTDSISTVLSGPAGLIKSLSS